MPTFFILMAFSLILIFILFFLGFLVSKKMNFYKSFMSPFECGFMPSSIYMPMFSIRFFVLTLVFLIFDIELVLLFPTIVMLNKKYLISLFSLVMLINLFSLGLLYEWSSTMLDWIY